MVRFDRKRWTARGIVIARGVALFFGAFSLLNALVAVVAHRNEDVWWLDLSFFPGPLPWAAGLIAAVALFEFAMRPTMPFQRRQLTAGTCAALAAVALSNAAGFFGVLRSGTITSGVGIPFSLVLAVVFAALAAVTWWGRPAEDSRTQRAAMVVAAVAASLLFPLAQVAFFGTTDYRRPADAAVVFGARVYDNGQLSGSLYDRVLTGVDLYDQGLVPRLIMSGGVGSNGIDESAAMKAFAVGRGVPAAAITCDSAGVDTDSTVRNTDALLPNKARILVVSQFYHLPRIKLAYRTVGRNVYTVPARETLPIPKTPLFVVREIPGFWVYWLRALWRDVSSV